VVTTVGGLTQPLITNSVAQSELRDERESAEFLASILGRVTTLIVGLSFGWALLLPVVFKVFEEDAHSSVAVSIIFVLLATLLPALVGISHGLLNFTAFTFAFMIGGLSRPLIFLVIVEFNQTLLAPLLALNFSLALTCLILIAKLPGGLKIFRGFTRPHALKLNRKIISSSAMILSIALLSYSDVIVARTNLRGEDVGNFAAAAMLTNVCLYGSMVVVSVLIPYVSRNRNLHNSEVQLARWSIMTVVLIGTCYSFFLLFYGQDLVSFTLGSQYSVEPRFFFFYNTVFVGVALCSLIVNFSVTKQSSQNMTFIFVAHSLLYLFALVITGNSMNAIVALTGATALSLILSSLCLKDSILRVALTPVEVTQ
jgi:MFS family permease